MEFTGRLTRWDAERGCGYIRPEQGGEDLFMPMSALQPGMVRPSVGDTICFRIEVDEKGGKRAARVHWPSAPPPTKRVVAPRPPRKHRRRGTSRIVFGVLLLLVAAGIYGFTRGRLPTHAVAPPAPASAAQP